MGSRIYRPLFSLTHPSWNLWTRRETLEGSIQFKGSTNNFFLKIQEKNKSCYKYFYFTFILIIQWQISRNKSTFNLRI